MHAVMSKYAVLWSRLTWSEAIVVRAFAEYTAADAEFS